MSDTLQFKVSSALKDLVGKDLITSDNVAIFELVKNSYDAYANHVIITFSEDKITIVDNGKGMSYADLRDKWLFLGFSAKKDGTEDNSTDGKQKSYRDKIKRYYAGAKGIGRFSCDRLGRYLTITTQTEGAPEAQQISVDWSKFEDDQKKEFSSIDVTHQSLVTLNVFPNNSPHGTRIEISDLHDEETPWTRKHILDLKRSLQKLINPFSETNDFLIEIVCERERANDEKQIEKGIDYDRDLVNGILRNSIVNILKLKTTQVDVKVENGYIYTTLSDRGVDIYKIKETNIDCSLIKNGAVTLSFLNRAAKYNFSRLMGVDSINYGSVFLFRNGFRILPYGETGDDSWGIDFRAQQGRARYLSSRDLMGRVDVFVENIGELKEVSSRDSGLVDSPMSRQVNELYWKCHKRLERYVVGVLWGEAFLKNEYYRDNTKGDAARKELQRIDKDSDNPSYVIGSSLGSKIDFVRLIKVLSSDNNVEVIYYNTELANLVSSNFAPEDIKPQFISDLETIAERTGNTELINKIDDAKRRIEELTREKVEAERKASEAERLQWEAEEKARKAEEERRIAESKAREEEERRRLAEIAKLRAENEKAKSEIARLQAEKKAKEEEGKRRQAEKEKEQVKKQNLFLQSVDSLDKDRIVKYHHDIRLHASTIHNTISSLIQKVNNKSLSDEELRKMAERIKRANNKVLSIAMFASKANFNTTGETLEDDIIAYIEQYVTQVLPDFYEDIKFHGIANGCKMVKRFKPLEVSLLIDNFVSNSINAKARNFSVEFSPMGDRVKIDIIDDGKGWSKEIDSRNVFDKGVSTTSGSGLGLYNAMQYIKTDLGGNIFIDTNYNSGIDGNPGAKIQIIL